MSWCVVSGAVRAKPEQMRFVPSARQASGNRKGSPLHGSAQSTSFHALGPSTTCQVASDIDHEPLHRYCSGIVHAQTNDIKSMREMLCKGFSICDYEPVVGLKGRHSGREGRQHTQGKWND